METVENGAETKTFAKSHLNTSLGEINLHGQVLTRKHVWIMGLGEGCLQFLELDKD